MTTYNLYQRQLHIIMCKYNSIVHYKTRQINLHCIDITSRRYEKYHLPRTDYELHLSKYRPCKFLSICSFTVLVIRRFHSNHDFVNIQPNTRLRLEHSFKSSRIYELFSNFSSSSSISVFISNLAPLNLLNLHYFYKCFHIFNLCLTLVLLAVRFCIFNLLVKNVCFECCEENIIDVFSNCSYQKHFYKAGLTDGDWNGTPGAGMLFYTLLIQISVCSFQREKKHYQTN